MSKENNDDNNDKQLSSGSNITSRKQEEQASEIGAKQNLRGGKKRGRGLWSGITEQVTKRAQNQDGKCQNWGTTKRKCANDEKRQRKCKSSYEAHNEKRTINKT